MLCCVVVSNVKRSILYLSRFQMMIVDGDAPTVESGNLCVCVPPEEERSSLKKSRQTKNYFLTLRTWRWFVIASDNRVLPINKALPRNPPPQQFHFKTSLDPSSLLFF